MTRKITVAKVGEIPPGTSRIVEAGGRSGTKSYEVTVETFSVSVEEGNVVVHL